jgi:YVTN family beta-propeller protein
MTGPSARRGVAVLAALICTALTGAPAYAGSASRTASASPLAARLGTGPGGRTPPGPPVAGPGTNLLLNAGAQAGAASAQGWDSVTIPGWRVVSGLPTVVRYGTVGFPVVTGHWPAVRGGQLFAGGAGGTARLSQVVPLRSPAGWPLPADTRYRLSAWLGGTAHSRAAVTVEFLSAAGGVLGWGQAGPIGGRQGNARLARRAAGGAVPPGTARALVTLVLATSLKNIDGPGAPRVGYDRAVADAAAFSVSVPVRRPPPLVPPVAHVPRYRHVFVFYFENEDFGSIIGNTRQAPYFNGLLPHASLLADFFAEEHPSDGNYLALAGGSTFGIPLDDPLEEDPRYTIDARNIGDLIDAAHETWKGYLQSADGPCDDTVHGYYWDDDLPMLYFADVRERPAYCSAHLVPLQELRVDLARASTTPAFAWVSPNDCTDMESCGIRAGDRFLAIELGQIMRSPAWRTQRCLAIVTFDEDGYDHEHPAQRIPTLVIGSSGVRRGYVSHVRYTHYSLLRTIEAALGLGTLTRNDLYAQPVNDVFEPGAAASPPAPPAVTAAAGPPAPAEPATAAPATAGPATRGPAGRGPTAFVVSSAPGTVTPIDTATGRAGPPIPAGTDPQAIAITPNGRTAYVANTGAGTVTPVDTATDRAGPPIPVGQDPQAIAITPDGRTAYVVNTGAGGPGTVTPIDTATGRAGPPIPAGIAPRAIAITPDGRTAYVLDWGGAAVTPIDLAAGRAGRPIRVGSYPFAIAITPDGTTAFVAGYGSDTVTPITIATGRAGRAIAVGQAPDALAVAPGGQTVYVADGDADTLTPVGVATGRAGRPIRVGYSPGGVAISRSGEAYVTDTISGAVTPVSTRSGRAGPRIGVGGYSYPVAITLTASGGTAVVIDTYAGQVTLIDTHTRRVTAHVRVGAYPVAVAIGP